MCAKGKLSHPIVVAFSAGQQFEGALRAVFECHGEHLHAAAQLYVRFVCPDALAARQGAPVGSRQHEGAEGFCRAAHGGRAARQRDVGAAASAGNAEAACHAVELLLHLFGCQVARAQVFQVLGGHAEVTVLFVAHVEEVDELEDVVRRVLLVEHGHGAALGRQLGQVFAVVQEYRFDGCGLGGFVLNLAEEGTGRVAVHACR